MTTATTPITRTAEQPEPFEISDADLDELFEAAARGDTLTVLRLSTNLQLGTFTYDIEYLTAQSQWYGPLESNGDALISLLQSHKDGELEINDHMRSFLKEAKAQMDAAGKPMSGEILKIYNKVMNGEKINEEDAKKFYSWCLDAKELVIPAEFRSSVIGEQLKRARQEYDQKVDAATRRQGSFSVR